MAVSRFVTFAALLATGCADAEPATLTAPTGALLTAEWRHDVRSARRTLLAADRSQAEAVAAVGFADGFTAYLSDPSVYLPPGHDPIRGTVPIRDYLETAYPSTAGFERTVARADVAVSGDVGYTFGWTATTVAGATVHGKYLAGWIRDGSGDWRVAAYLPNASAGPAGEVPAWFRDLVDNGVRSARPPGEVDPRASMLDADRDFAALSVSAGAAEAFGRYAARQGVAVANGGGMIFGRAAIREAYAFPPGYVLRWAPLDGIAASTGDIGFSWGRYELDVPTTDGVVTLHGKYLSLWEMQPAGDWRFVADGGNANPPPGP